MNIVRVSLEHHRSYPIYIGSDVLSRTGEFFRKHSLPAQTVVITDRNVAERYLPVVKKSLEEKGFSVYSIILPSGEKQKSLSVCNTIYTRLLQQRITRTSVVVALGGGVIGDLAGFIAATYQRGIDFVQIPTSLLSQVDSSVGGKVGVNHPLAKNMIGAFYQPKFVIADSSALRTLPQREIICGLGEVVKYGIIMNKDFFNFVEENLSQAVNGNTDIFSSFVEESCTMKAFIVSKDEKENGLRAILNFGHTIGHALEQAGKYRVLKHGEAVLLGMAAEAFISRQLGLLNDNSFNQIFNVIKSIPLPSLKKLPLHSTTLLDTMRKDKKSTAVSIRMVLAKKIGKTTLPFPVQEDVIRESIKFLQKNF
ncbi:MAG: 3-dehydroquinate synthase [Bacteroidetes bacterium]|nr:3-dehydroquinate synthase [Bacteroidota bacterium]